MRCPWYHPHLHSLCTVLAALENFLLCWRHVLLSGHPTPPPFFICRYFLPCCAVLFSPWSPPFSKPSASSHSVAVIPCPLHPPRGSFSKFQTLFHALLDQTLMPPTLPYPQRRFWLPCPEGKFWFWLCTSAHSLFSRNLGQLLHVPFCLPYFPELMMLFLATSHCQPYPSKCPAILSLHHLRSLTQLRTYQLLLFNQHHILSNTLTPSWPWLQSQVSLVLYNSTESLVWTTFKNFLYNAYETRVSRPWHYGHLGSDDHCGGWPVPCGMLSNIPCFYALYSSSTQLFPSCYDNEEFVQILPTVPLGRNHPWLRTFALKEWNIKRTSEVEDLSVTWKSLLSFHIEKSRFLYTELFQSGIHLNIHIHATYYFHICLVDHSHSLDSGSLHYVCLFM